MDYTDPRQNPVPSPTSPRAPRGGEFGIAAYATPSTRQFPIAISSRTVNNGCTHRKRTFLSAFLFSLPTNPMAVTMQPSFRSQFLLPWCCILAAVTVCLRPLTVSAVDLTGKKLYEAKCVRCHGPEGTGTVKHRDHLVGDLSVAQLSDVILETMPENDPGSLTAVESEAVARFVHESFYSPVARQRNRPPRIELARLTVSQYRRAVTDLFGTF